MGGGDSGGKDPHHHREMVLKEGLQSLQVPGCILGGG